MDGQGKSFSKAKEFLTEYTKDGLIPLTNAVTSYKNLAARGYDDKQIQQTLTSLKDAAAFGRQASYSYGEAIQSATEGLKNENSILVDNAGVTKNVAKMWEDYARSVGKTTNQLTQQEKITAEVNGILEETKFQVGDATKYASTFSGRLARLNQAFYTLKDSIGKVIMPIANLFIPVIQVAMDKLISFFNVVQKVMSAFGLKSESISNNASSSFDNLASSATSAADKASKASKKINKTMNYDELNILSKNDKSSPDSSASSGGTSVSNPISNITDTVVEDKVSPQIQKIVDKCTNLLSKLKNISFDKLSKSFSNLYQAISPFTQVIFSGLEWGYTNILVPLAKWTIEDILPNFINIFSSGLKILTSAIEGLQPLWKWCWDNFLKPIASWSGDVISSTISLIADSLRKISSWCSENQGIVDNMVTTLAIFFGLWELTKLMGFIQMSGGIIGAFTGITAAIWSCTGAKIADKMETIAITALYAKDFLVSIVSGTGALIKQGAQWIITTGLKIADTAATVAGTAATWLATAATTAFGVAMTVLTSPITLVILAIAGLVAGIVLLVKNFDTVKEVAGKCWDGIKNVWNSVSSWFNEHVIQPISNFFGGLWNGIQNKASECWSKITGLFSKGGQIFNGIKDGVVNVFKTVVNSLISGINTLIAIPFKTINGMLNKIRSISFLGISPFEGLWKENPLPVPEIPKLAQGGWVEPNKPRTVIVGDNKHEGEIISPESKIYEQNRKAIRDEMQNYKGGLPEVMEWHFYHHYEDGRVIIEKINKQQILDGKITLLT